MPTLYISPTGAGLRDGSSPANAGALTDLPAFVDAAGPGGEVLLIADEGPYQHDAEINISAGGTPEGDVTVRGVDGAGNPMAAEIVGTRAENWTAGQPQGTPLFNLLSGADHLTFQDLAFRNIGDGVFRVGNDIQDLTIQHVDAVNVNRFFRDQALESATSATISGLVVKDVTVTGYSKGAFLLKYDTHDVLFEDVVGDSQGQDGALYIIGVQIAGTAHDIVLRRVEMNNNFGRADSDEYWNGDGFTTERENYNILFEDTRASGNADAGYDIKSTDTVLLRAVSEGNKHNYRIWGDTVTLEDSVSLNPVKLGGTGSVSHVELLDGASARFENFSVSDSGPPAILFDMVTGHALVQLVGTTIPDAYADRIASRRGSTIEVLPSDDPTHVSDTAANDAPIWIAVTGGVLQENADPGTVAATLSALDPDLGDSHTYAITGGASERFEIVGNQILVREGAILDNDTRNLHGINVTVTDAGGLSYTQTVYIRLTEVSETGTPGDDTLAGGSGGDTLTGREGNDTYWVNSPRDVLVERSAEGDDLAYVKISSYTLANYVEQMVFKGTGAFTGIGNSSNNTVTGGSDADMLDGAGGNDILYGALGADTLAGGTANDQLHGGADADTVRGGAGNDSLWGDAGDDLLFGGEGFDSLYGADGNDVLDGGALNDRMFGDRGNDTYIVNTSGDVVTEKSGQGTDWVYSAVSYTLGDHVEHLALTGVAETTGIGNTLNNQIIGSGANNVLAGGDGNDVLDGGAGNDRLVGGRGTDTYRFDIGGGQDTIKNADTGASPDRLIFGAGIGEDDLWFSKLGNNLVVTVLGGGDQVTLLDWYVGSANRLDRFELADGTVLQAGDVPNLVSAMAVTSPPPSLAALNDDQEHAVAAAIAAAWQA